MDNPIRRLRQLIGVNQAEFARLIGRSHQSVGLYERGGDVPYEVIERIKTLATERGYADIAIELSSTDWQMRREFRPGETIISQHRPSPPGPADRPIRLPENQPWHDMLDEILTSGIEDAVKAVQSNLIVFADYVAGPRSVRPRKVPRASAK